VSRVILAVHPRVRPLVLPGADIAVPGVQWADPGESLWSAGWPADAAVAAVVTGWGTPPLDDDALDRMPALRAILHVGGSVREVLGADVWARGIQVTSAADVNNDAVADYVHAMILLSLKGSLRAGADMRRTGRLAGPSGGIGSVGAAVGLVSYGSIARKVRRRLRPLNAAVRAWDPFVPSADLEADDVVSVETLPELFRASMVVSVHAPLIPGQTEGLITGELLSSLPHGATFLNTARGALVDESAMVEVLTARGDLFAVLDVTSPEPPASSSSLWELPNVLLTGHTAGSVGTENRRMGASILRSLAEFAAGAPLPGAISAAAAMTRA
jgi:phosphoglycerate dehydrogenase-like enzyme